ncbi:hypothetical protein IGI39_001450 [Enterococcus sp. AZ135]|uniref:helix-turn-helix domain-containing protein n=1 Tax=unclassified Enterococcus TaxID=2608891 RepID=UPI003F26543B
MFPNYLKKELSMLFYIVKRTHTSLNEISTTLSVSKRTVKENLIKINRAFADFRSMNDFIISSSSGVICVNSKYRHCAVEYAYGLKLDLLKTNAQFNYCVQLVTHSKIDKEDLIKLLYISEHYLVKLTQQLNVFFKSYNICIVNTRGVYSLKGNELSIRIFSYIFLQDSFQELEWPFCEISIQEIKEKIPNEILESSYKRSKTKKRALYILYAVLQTRISNQSFLRMPASKNLMVFFRLICQHYDVALIFYEDSFSSLNLETRRSEILYFNFLSRIFIPYIFSREQKKELGQLFLQSNHPYCQLAKEIFYQVSFLLTDNKSKESIYQYIYYITIFNTWFFLTEGNYPVFLELYMPQLDIYLPDNNEYFNSIKRIVSKTIDKSDQIELLSRLLYTLSISEKEPELKIYLQIIKDFSADYFIKNRLSSLYNEHNIYITDDYSAADIIITDSFEKSATNKEIFYLDSIGNEECWHELTELIQQKYIEKLTLEYH